MKKIILLFSFFILIEHSYAQKTISVLSGTTWTFYEDFSTALRQAPSGATVYLPGGLFTISDGSDTITKPLTIIGVGHFPDSTQATLPTIISGYLWLSQGADNSSFIGLNILNGGIQIPNWGNNITVSNINISRCKLSSIGIFWFPLTNKIKNLLVSECIITGDIGGYVTEPLNIVFEKSILPLISDLEDVTFRNNLIQQVGANIDHPLRNCIFDII